MRSAGRDFLGLLGVAIIVGGLAAALALLFVPLAVQRTSGQVSGWCGPGLTSDNAVQVRLDPGIVNTGAPSGEPSVSAAQALKFEQFCTHEADSQLVEAAVVAALALLIGLPLIASGVRQARKPASPDAAPPSLSSSGTPGSTVWK